MKAHASLGYIEKQKNPVSLSYKTHPHSFYLCEKGLAMQPRLALNSRLSLLSVLLITERRRHTQFVLASFQ